MVVINYAVTPLDHLNVSVMLVIDQLPMVSRVMVCISVAFMSMDRSEILSFNVDINECMEESDRCDHNCQNTEGSYTCTCSEGFLLDNDGYSCIGMLQYDILMPQRLQKQQYGDMIWDHCIICNVEIDECQDGNSSCEQVCMNTIGSYECTCNDGYRLNRDGLTCSGIANGCHFSVDS